MAQSRKASRVRFERGVPMHMMAIDGTWQRTCTLLDASDSGAKLRVDGPLQETNLKEFFLLLSSFGAAYRRCQLVWVNGDQIGVTFLREAHKKAK